MPTPANPRCRQATGGLRSLRAYTHVMPASKERTERAIDRGRGKPPGNDETAGPMGTGGLVSAARGHDVDSMRL